jgi:hypothetical protein
MLAYVKPEYRSVSRRHSLWWHFYTEPEKYNVWYKPDGKNEKKTLDQFLAEQVAAIKEYEANANRA